jgi:hypothetical protein
MGSSQLGATLVSPTDERQGESPEAPDVAALSEETTSLGSYVLRWLVFDKEQRHP